MPSSDESTWTPTTIGAVADVYDGPHATPTTVDHGPIFLGIDALQNGRIALGATRHVRQEDFVTWTRRIKPLPGDVVFSYETKLGEAAIIPEGLECCLGRRMGLVRAKPNRLAPRFFLYLFLSPAFQALIKRRTITGATVDRIALKEFPSFPIILPSFAEQTAIAAVLGALDDKIELNRRMNETLERTARAIFQDWFVDFGPTRAKMEGREAYLAPEVWEMFPDAFDDEGKPEGWVTSTIGQEVDVVGGSTPSTQEPAFWGGDIAWATPKDLSSLGCPVLFNTERQITKAGLAQIGSGLLPVGTVLLSSRAPIGYLAMVQIPVAVNQGFIAMVCQRRLSNVFVCLWTKANMETIHQNANGSTFQEISKANFRPIKMTIGSSAILQAFDAASMPLFERIVANEKESRTLAATRDFLLPKLMSGEIRVKDAEAVAADVL